VPLGRIDAAELSLALRVGLEAPMLPCAAFLDASADPRAFGERTRFARFKTEGRLDSAKAAAAKVVALLERPDYEANPVGDVRDA